MRTQRDRLHHTLRAVNKGPCPSPVLVYVDVTVAVSANVAKRSLSRGHSINISFIELIDWVKIITTGEIYIFVKRMFSYQESGNVVRKV